MNTIEFLLKKYDSVLLTTEQVAEVFCMRPKSLSNAILLGKLPGLKKAGETSRYHVETVAKVLDDMR
jgi:hypothetical protein